MKTRAQKRIIFVLLLLGLILLIVFSSFFLYQYLRQRVLHIAVVMPLSGPDKIIGEQMRQGIRLYLETVRRDGRLPGTRIKLIEIDDRNDLRAATEAASRIVTENSALLVLGHYSEATSLAAGKIYKRYRIPAITASAAAEDVTLENEWYFRIFPNSRFQAAFIAHYIKHVLKTNKVSLVFDSTNYGTSLTESFGEVARRIGIEIITKQGLNVKRGNLEQQMDRLVERLASLEDPGVIFLAMHQAEAVKIITSLQQPEHPYAIIGPDIFSTETMIAEFDKYPQEREQPGYYSDGIYAISPFMIDIANQQAQLFKQRFTRAYPEEPISWIAACYYDATAVALKAIESSELEGKGHIRGDRQKIRDALIGFYDPKTSVKGITGELYFDADRNVGRPLVVGIYNQQRLLPTFTQFQAGSSTSENPFEGVLSGKLIIVDHYQMIQTQVVYTGAHINALRDVDLENSRYTIDFYLWFRFQRDFQDVALIFNNALTPVTLEEPVWEEDSQGVITRVYRVIAEFTHDVDLRIYPFDTQTLPIIFQHATLPSEELIYVPDQLEPPQIVQQYAESNPLQASLEGWKLTDIFPTQDIDSTISTLGNPEFFGTTHRINASQFTMNVQITREEQRVLAQELLPLLLILGGIGIIYFFSSAHLRIRLIILMLALIATAVYHVRFLLVSPTDYIVSLEYVYFTFYGLLVFSVSVTVSAYAFYRKRLALVNSFDLFQTFSEKMKATLSKKMRRCRLKKPGQPIIRQGEEGNSLFVIIEGEMSAQITLEDGNRLEVNYLKAGDFFGEMALLTGEPRSADVISATPAFLGEITKADIAPFLKQHPELVTAMSEELTRRKLWEMQKKDQYEAQQMDQQELSDQFSTSIRRFFGM